MEFLGQNIQRKKRSLVKYIDCPGHPETPPPRVDSEPDLSPATVKEADRVGKMTNEDDPVGKISSTSENGNNPNAEIDDPVGRISPVLENRVDPSAAMENDDNPVVGIPVAPENRVDPNAEIEVAGEEMPAEMREYIRERMGGYRVQMIIEKALTTTDMRKGQGRLSLPVKQLKAEFLTAEEESYFVDRIEVDNGLNYIDTIVVGSDLRENPMQFKKWLLGSRYVDFLLKHWNSFSKTYELKVGNRVRIWSFRVDQRDDENGIVKSELRFALIKL